MAEIHAGYGVAIRAVAIRAGTEVQALAVLYVGGRDHSLLGMGGCLVLRAASNQNND